MVETAKQIRERRMKSNPDDYPLSDSYHEGFAGIVGVVTDRWCRVCETHIDQPRHRPYCFVGWKERATLAERDTVRLDWVLQHGARWTDDGKSTDRPGYWYAIEWDFGGRCEGLSLRDAVDAGTVKLAAETPSLVTKGETHG